MRIFFLVIAAGLLLTMPTSAAPLAQEPITVPEGVERQMFNWINEDGGLVDWLLTHDPTHPRHDQMQGELRLYDVLLDAAALGALDLRLIDDQMIRALEWVLDSYVPARDYAYTVDDIQTSRDEIKRFLNDVYVLLGEPSKLVEDDPITATLKNASTLTSENTQYAIANESAAISAGCSEGAGDGDGDWHDELDEGFGAGRGAGTGPDDDTTFWECVLSTGIKTITTGHKSIFPPTSNGSHIYRVRAEKSAPLGKQVDVEVELIEGGTIIADTTLLDIQAVWTTIIDTLTSLQTTGISDYDALEVRTRGEQVGGGTDRDLKVSTHEISAPDASFVFVN